MLLDKILYKCHIKKITQFVNPNNNIHEMIDCHTNCSYLNQLFFRRVIHMYTNRGTNNGTDFMIVPYKQLPLEKIVIAASFYRRCPKSRSQHVHRKRKLMAISGDRRTNGLLLTTVINYNPYKKAWKNVLPHKI